MPKQLIKFATVLALILFSTSLQAQIDFEKTDHGVNINFFNGYAISYKWNTTQNLNYRVYLSLNSSWTDSDEEYESEAINSDPNYSNYSREFDKNNNYFYLGSNLSFQFIYNIISEKGCNFYLGVGPNINYSYSNSSDGRTVNNRRLRNSIPNRDNSECESSSSSYSFGIGIISLTGIEVFLAKNISLFAESHIIGQKTWGKSDFSGNCIKAQNGTSYTEKGTNNKTTSGWNVNLQLVKVGLGIYF